jgi:hypothetical protein
MVDGTDTLGLRILRAARFAAALHMNQVAESHAGVRRGQRVMIGGAGPRVTGASPAAIDYSTDGVLSAGIVGGSRGAGHHPGAATFPSAPSPLADAGDHGAGR